MNLCEQCNKETKNAKYCSCECSGLAHSERQLSLMCKQFIEGRRIHREWVYRILVIRDGNACYSCGINEWLGKPLRLWVDHIDGNASNNTPENFRLVCPNCDFQSDTFGGKNRGKGRKSLGLKQYD